MTTQVCAALISNRDLKIMGMISNLPSGWSDKMFAYIAGGTPSLLLLLLLLTPMLQLL